MLGSKPGVLAGYVYLILRQKSQNQAIDAQRGQGLRLFGEDFEFARTGSVTLAATQHHPNRIWQRVGKSPERFRNWE